MWTALLHPPYITMHFMPLFFPSPSSLPLLLLPPPFPCRAFIPCGSDTILLSGAVDVIPMGILSPTS